MSGLESKQLNQRRCVGRMALSARAWPWSRSAPQRRRLSRPTTFPTCYQETWVALIEVQAFWLHAHWEIGPVDRERRLREGGGAWVLRVYDVTMIMFDGGNAHGYFDIEVAETARNHYINLWVSGRSYLAELGFRRVDGGFTALARSEGVILARAFPACDGERLWLWVKSDPRRRVAAADATPAQPRRKVGTPMFASYIEDVNQLMERVTAKDVRSFYDELWAGLKGNREAAAPGTTAGAVAAQMEGGMK